MHQPPHGERTRLAADQRRTLLIEAAYMLIAEKGLLGLRIRDVAERVGVNHTTLLYHFPTKEALISAVIDHVGDIFLTTQAPESPPLDAPSPADFLHQYFINLDYQLRCQPQPFLVIDELFLQGRRDETLRSLLHAEVIWENYLGHILAEGYEQGCFVQRLPTSRVVQAIMVFCKGLPLQTFASPSEMTQLIQQFEQWVLATLLPEPQT